MPEHANNRSARVELIQALSGLLLVLFVWCHMFFESSILLGMDAMYWVTGMFEGYHLLGERYPLIVSAAALVILALVIVHAVLALRKIPDSYRQHRLFRQHMNALGHPDTSLWYLQVVTGLVLFFLVPVHLGTVILEPDDIGPYASSDRVWSERAWMLYAPLLLAVHLHAAAGVYRLYLKWGLPQGMPVAKARGPARKAMYAIVIFFLLLGSASLTRYMQIGADHADHAGERYKPHAVETGGTHDGQ